MSFNPIPPGGSPPREVFDAACGVVSDGAIEALHRDGVVCLRNFTSPGYVDPDFIDPSLVDGDRFFSERFPKVRG